MVRVRLAASRAGFTLIEVMIALAVFACAFLALAQLVGASARATQQARRTSMATALAAQKVEQWRSLVWGYDLAGRERQDSTSDASRWPDAPAGGGGLALSPLDALAADREGFVDYLDDSGRWVGSGSSPPRGTVFVRRWSIDAVDASPATTLVLRVVVLCRGSGGDGRPGTRPASPSASEVELVRLVSIKARRAR